jgi:hypothetical protein
MGLEEIACQWVYDGFEDCWSTECGNAFCFIDAGPSENEFKFCPYCGKGITAIADDFGTD